MSPHEPRHLNNPRWMSNLSFDKDNGRQNVREKVMKRNTLLRTSSCLLCCHPDTFFLAFMTQGFRAEQMFDTFGQMAASQTTAWNIVQSVTCLQETKCHPNRKHLNLI